MTPLDKFGEFIIKNFRDKAIEQHYMLQEGKLRGKAIQELQKIVSAWPEENKEILGKVVVDLLDTALHDILFAFQESHDLEEGIEVIVDGTNIAESSGMLNGEPLGDEGWIARFSHYKKSLNN